MTTETQTEYPGIAAFFAERPTLKRLKLLSEGVVLKRRDQPLGRHRIVVTTARAYGHDRMVAAIASDGAYRGFAISFTVDVGDGGPGRWVTADDLVSLLDRIEGDPAAVLAEIGRAGGACCFCARSLTDDADGGSIERGYGPVCARKYGLPHSTQQP